MKRLIFAGLALVLSIGMSAAQSYKDAPANPNLWQGIYVGVGVGGVFDYENLSGGSTSINSIGNNGYTEKATLGYDYTFSRWLIGAWAEGDLQETNTKLTGVSFNANKVAGAFGMRGGYIVAPNVLAYATVGYAINGYSVNAPNSNVNTLNGVTYGGGFEYAVSSNIFLQTEYRHDTYAEAPVAGLKDFVDDNRVTIGLLYKFNNSATLPALLTPNKGYVPLK